MNQKDKVNWRNKTKRLNIDVILKVGDSVIDIDKNRGIVVKIEPGTDIENHGTIYVWQLDRTYGSDNCEHYVHFGWQENLRIQ